MTIDLLDIGKIAVSSSILSAVTTWGLNHFFVIRASLARDAKYTALRVALVLEKFAFDCADALWDNEESKSSDGHAGSELTAVPTLGEFPPDADWKALHVDLTNRALTLPIALLQAGRAIVFWWNTVADHDWMVEEACQQTGFVGLNAWQIASDLRRRYDIPEFRRDKGAAHVLKILTEHAAAKLRSDARYSS